MGSRLGPYEITAAIGAGGMGEVYRARDTKLGRDVAIKVLPEVFTHDSARMARFSLLAGFQIHQSNRHMMTALCGFFLLSASVPAGIQRFQDVARYDGRRVYRARYSCAAVGAWNNGGLTSSG